ncbi:unnamed protein product [Alternaria burnsii]|nr:unnamed protein product [Alternaria burnsii]
MPPPIPIRSHLRNGSAYQKRLHAIRSMSTNSKGAPSFPFSLNLLEEFDHELTETQSLVSAILGDKNMNSKKESSCWDSGKETDTMTERRQTGSTLGDMCSSEVESKVSYCDGYPKILRLDPLKISSTAATNYSRNATGDQSESLFGQIGVRECVPSLRGSHDGTTSANRTNHAIYSNNTLPPSDYSAEKMDTNVPGWPAQELLSPRSDEPGSPRQATSNSDRPFPSRHVNLSLFPPMSPSTGNREYTPPGSPFSRPIRPMSPLSNGRDAYGNYIASNKLDYLKIHSPLTSPVKRAVSDSQEHSEPDISSPIVHLRGGGWNDFKSFWKTTDTNEIDQPFGSTSLQESVDKEGILRVVSPIHYIERPESRAPQSVRSQFQISRAGKVDKITEETPRRPCTVDKRRDGQLFREIGTRQGSNTSDSGVTNDSSIHRACTEAVLNQYFGPQMSLPIRDGPQSPPIDKTLAPPNLQSAPTGENETTCHSMSPSYPVASRKFALWNNVESKEHQGTDATLRSHMVNPRDNKRWARERPTPPPILPLSNPPRCQRADPSEADVFESSNDDSCRASSLLSAGTLDDNLMDVLGLEKTDAYRRFKHERAIQLIQEERQRYKEADCICDVNVRLQEELRRREPDLSTTVLDDSFTAVMRRQSTGRRHELERMAVSDERRPPVSPTPSRYLPRYGRITAKAQVVPQQRNAQYLTIGYPSIVSTPGVAESAPIKGQNPLQTVISKAGEISRLILAAPSGSRYKTYSKRHPLAEYQEKKPQGLGADATGWPRNGKSFSTAAKGMLISTQVPSSETTFAGVQPPRGRRVNKVKEPKHKQWGGRWGRRLKEIAIPGDIAPTDLRGGGSSATSTADTNRRPNRSRGATRLQHTRFVRSGPRARSSSPKASTIILPVSKQLEHTFATTSDAVRTPQTRFDLPDSEGRCFVRRDDREVLPLSPAPGSPYHDRLNTCYEFDTADAATLKWLEGIHTQTGVIAEPVVNMRGGDVLFTMGEASSLSSYYLSLTSEAMTLNSDNDTIDNSNIDALLVSTTHLNINQITDVAITPANGISEDDIRPHLYEANVRSSFSTDSTIELRLKMNAKKNIWRNEDQARAMAMAMHSIG